jgi:hypothetical protein
MDHRRVVAVALGLALSLTACSAGPTSSDPAGGGNANRAEGFEGSLATSGRYVATWTVSPEAKADVFNSTNSVTLTSEHQTFANVRVKPDGTISFGSAATELASNGAYNGSGAKVTLDKSGQLVCAFSVDTDLVGSNDSAALHIKGSMSVNWHPEGIGDLSCP